MGGTEKRNILSEVALGNIPPDTLGTPTLPHLRITHQGYVNVKDQKNPSR